MGDLLQYRFPVTDGARRPEPGRACPRQPAARGGHGPRGRGLRGGRPAAQPDPGRARPGRAGDGDPAHLHARLHATARPSMASRGSCARPASSASGSRPDDVRPTGRRPDRHRRGRPHRHRPGQPVHEHPARACSCPASATPCSAATALRVYVCNVATQAGETARHDPGRARRCARRPHRAAAGRRRAGQRSVRCPRAGRLDRRGRPARLAARRDARPRGSSSTRSSTPTTPTTTTRRAWPRRSCGLYEETVGRAPQDVGPHGMTSSDRDLVVALRNELAAIDPARPCDRVAEAAGLEATVAGREPAVVAAARAPATRQRRRRGLRLGRPPPSTAGWPGCAAASWPAARSACPAAGRTSSSSSRSTRRRSSPAGWPTSACPRRGASDAARAS